MKTKNSSLARSRSVILSFALLSAGAPQAHAQTATGGGGGGGGMLAPGPTLPIQNLGVLKAFARSQTVSAELYIYGSSIEPKGYVSQSFKISYSYQNETPELVMGADATALLAQINSYQASFLVTRVTDALYVQTVLRNKDGYALFSGSKQDVRLQGGKGGGAYFSAELSLNLSEQIPIPYHGVQAARIVVRRPDGAVTADRTLPLGNGYILYPTSAAGHQGELIVTDTSGNTRVFDLASGSSRGVDQVQGFVGVGINGEYHFIDPFTIGGFVTEPRGAIVFAEFTKSGDVLLVPSGWKVRPVAVLIRNPDLPMNNPWAVVTIANDGRNFTMGFGPGKYLIVYVLPGDSLDNIPVVFPGDEAKG